MIITLDNHKFIYKILNYGSIYISIQKYNFYMCEKKDFLVCVNI